MVGPGGEDEVVHVLRNTRKPLALGYIMVKNLSQKQVNEGVNQQQAKLLEKEYFQTHSEFSQLSGTLFGVDNLVTACTKVLVSNIKRSLPEIKKDLELMLQSSLQELSELGLGLPVDIRDQQSLIMDRVMNEGHMLYNSLPPIPCFTVCNFFQISSFCRCFRQSSRGDYRDGVLAMTPAARLHIQMQWAYKAFQTQIQELRPAPGTEIETALSSRLVTDMTELRGRELCCFLNSQVLFANVVNLVELWRPHMEVQAAEIKV
jgi:hypothetical protein